MSEQSSTLRVYDKWVKTATEKQLEFVNSVFLFCEEHYSAGGDTVVECFSPKEILAEFSSIDDVREYIGLRIEQELNARWGEDDDPQLARAKEYNDKIARK